MNARLILWTVLLLAGCSSREAGRSPIAEKDMLGRYRANFPERVDEIELLSGGKYRHTVEYRSRHEQQSGDWFIGPQQTEITLRHFKFNWPSPLRTLPSGGIDGITQFPPVSDWTTPVRVEQGVPRLLIAEDNRYYYRKQR